MMGVKEILGRENFRGVKQMLGRNKNFQGIKMGNEQKVIKNIFGA